MKLPNTLVSVIVPTYRRGDELARALVSLREQTYSPIEIVVCDDNDNEEWNIKVEGIIKQIQTQNPDISIKYAQNHPNLGSAKNRNLGIELCSGEYICFLDDDDLFLPDRIKNQIIAMQESKADYSITDLSLYSEDDRLIETRRRSYIEETSPAALLRYHLMYHITGTDTMMFKKEYLLKIGGFPPIDVGDEFYLMQKAIEGEGRFLYVPTCDVKAYVHTGDTGLSSGKSKINGENQLFEHKKKYFSKLDKVAIKYIKMRHQAVLAFAYFKMRKIPQFFLHGFLAFVISPKNCFGLLKNM